MSQLLTAISCNSNRAENTLIKIQICQLLNQLTWLSL